MTEAEVILKLNELLSLPAETEVVEFKEAKNKAFNKQYYLDLIKKAIAEHGSLTRKDIDELLFNKLSDVTTDKQKKIKINNLISELRRNGIVKNLGTYNAPIWVLINEKY